MYIYIFICLSLYISFERKGNKSMSDRVGKGGREERKGERVEEKRAARREIK